jgi:hypothetical protein
MENDLSNTALTGDIFIRTASGGIDRDLDGAFDKLQADPNDEIDLFIEVGQGRDPVVEVSFPLLAVNPKSCITSSADEQTKKKATLKALGLNLTVRGKCISNTQDYACVLLNPGITEAMDEADIRMVQVNGKSTFIMPGTKVNEFLSTDKCAPFLDDALLIAPHRMKVIKRKGIEPTPREVALARATGHEILRRRSYPMRATLLPALAAESPHPEG